MRSKRWSAAAAFLGCMFGVAACGQQADVGPETGSTAGASLEAGSQELALTQCLRDEGIAITDPQPGQLPVFEDADSFDPAALEAALQKCGKKLGLPPEALQPGTGPEVTAMMVQVAECLRGKGHDVPDPLVGQELQIDESVPEADLNACFQQLESHLPGGEETK